MVRRSKPAPSPADALLESIVPTPPRASRSKRKPPAVEIPTKTVEPPPAAATLDAADEAAILAAPPSLEGEALAAWSMLAPLLRKLRAQDGIPLLTAGSRHALAMYCVAWSDWLDAVARIAADGPLLESATGYKYAHPAGGMKKTAATTIRQLGKEFGLTPANRAAMGVSTGETDALSAFIGAAK